MECATKDQHEHFANIQKPVNLNIGKIAEGGRLGVIGPGLVQGGLPHLKLLPGKTAEAAKKRSTDLRRRLRTSRTRSCRISRRP